MATCDTGDSAIKCDATKYDNTAVLAVLNAKIEAIKKLIDANAHKHTEILEKLYANAISRDQYDAMRREYDIQFKHDTEFNVQIDMKIYIINTELIENRKKITDRAKLRDQEPNFNVHQVLDLVEKIATLEKQRRVMPNMPDIIKLYPTYANYVLSRRPLEKELDSIRHMCKKLFDEQLLLEKTLLEETWRPKYIKYAIDNNVSDIDFDDPDDTSIFEKCNEDHMVNLMSTSGFSIDCPCNASIASGEDDCYDSHVLRDTDEGRCTRGTKMVVDYSSCFDIIGFIDTTKGYEDYITCTLK